MLNKILSLETLLRRKNEKSHRKAILVTNISNNKIIIYSLIKEAALILNTTGI